MNRTTLFVDVILPLPVPGLFTYRVPYELNDSVGRWKRVVIQFGKKKVYTAIIVNIHETPPQNYAVKYILSVLDANPIMNHLQFKFWQWISAYYMCEPGEVMNVAIPSAFKLASESRIILNPNFEGDIEGLNEKEYLVVDALDIQKKLTLTEVENIIEQKKVIPVIKGLIEKNIVVVEEELKERYKPKKETYLRLSEEYLDESKLQELFNQLEKRAFKQLEVLMAFISLSNFGSDKIRDVRKGELTKKQNFGQGVIKALVNKGVLITSAKIISRLGDFDASSQPEDIELSLDQKETLDHIKSSFSDKNTVLLHGVTSSGKTELYIKLIQDALEHRKQVLYLLPEIALTTQIINRLRKYFGNLVGVYHSRYNENERVEIWNNVLNNKINKTKYQIILGPRSALYLPYSNLGLVIVDEEHDYSYKQFDPAPRYNARDAAVYLAGLHQANVLLGSATPSLESYYNTKTEKYSLVELKKRFGDIQLPEILVADVKKETRQKTMKSHFSSLLLDHVSESLIMRLFLPFINKPVKDGHYKKYKHSNQQNILSKAEFITFSNFWAYRVFWFRRRFFCPFSRFHNNFFLIA